VQIRIPRETTKELAMARPSTPATPEQTAPDPFVMAREQLKTREAAVKDVAERNLRAHQEAKRKLEARRRTREELRRGLEF
jgi:hypothetical protein